MKGIIAHCGVHIQDGLVKYVTGFTLLLRTQILQGFLSMCCLGLTLMDGSLEDIPQSEHSTFAASKTDQPVTTTLRIIYISSPLGTDSKTNPEEAVVCVCMTIAGAFSDFVKCGGILQKCGSKVWQYSACSWFVIFVEVFFVQQLSWLVLAFGMSLSGERLD